MTHRRFAVLTRDATAVDRSGYVRSSVCDRSNKPGNFDRSFDDFLKRIQLLALLRFMGYAGVCGSMCGTKKVILS
jgi:hypothetical protein